MYRVLGLFTYTYLPMQYIENMHKDGKITEKIK